MYVYTLTKSVILNKNGYLRENLDSFNIELNFEDIICFSYSAFNVAKSSAMDCFINFLYQPTEIPDDVYTGVSRDITYL